MVRGRKFKGVGLKWSGGEEDIRWKLGLLHAQVHEQSHIAHSQGLTNGLSDRDYRVLTISLFYVQSIL